MLSLPRHPRYRTCEPVGAALAAAQALFPLSTAAAVAPWACCSPASCRDSSLELPCDSATLSNSNFSWPCSFPGPPPMLSPCGDSITDPEGPCHGPQSPIQKKFCDLVKVARSLQPPPPATQHRPSLPDARTRSTVDAFLVRRASRQRERSIPVVGAMLRCLRHPDRPSAEPRGLPTLLYPLV